MTPLSISNGASITAHTIYGIGRNYAAHAQEMGSEVPKEPIVFMKPLSALCVAPREIVLPADVGRVDHEVEWVVVLGKGGKNLDTRQALASIAAVGVGLDLTARDYQNTAKQTGTPWTLAKGLDGFGVVGPLVAFDPSQMPYRFSLRVGEEERQSGTTSNMIFSIEALLVALSRRFTLAPGTILFTGTPQGIGPLEDGDRIDAILHGTESRICATVRRERSAR